jgi:hypothetical protein
MVEIGSVAGGQISSSWRELRGGAPDRGGVHIAAFYAAQSVLYSEGHRALDPCDSSLRRPLS